MALAFYGSATGLAATSSIELSCAREIAAGVIPDLHANEMELHIISWARRTHITYIRELSKRRRASATSPYRTFDLELPKILSLLSKSLPRNFFSIAISVARTPASN